MAIFASSVVVNDALARIGKLFGYPLDWEPTNDFQELILRHAQDAEKIGKTLSDDQLFGIAAHSCGPVNTFLVNHKFGNIRLDDQGSGPNFAYVASILKLLGMWKQPGEKGYYLPATMKPGFRFEPNPYMTHYQSNHQRLLRIQTEAGFDMWLSEYIPGLLNFEMIDRWIELLGEAEQAKGNGGVLPFVDIQDAKVDIHKLLGMRAGNVVISQAKSAAKFKLTNIQISFEMAVVLGALRFGGDEPLPPQPGDFVVGNTLNFALVSPRRPLMPLAVGRVEGNEFSETAEIS